MQVQNKTQTLMKSVAFLRKAWKRGEEINNKTKKTLQIYGFVHKGIQKKRLVKPKDVLPKLEWIYVKNQPLDTMKELMIIITLWFW